MRFGALNDRRRKRRSPSWQNDCKVGQQTEEIRSLSLSDNPNSTSKRPRIARFFHCIRNLGSRRDSRTMNYGNGRISSARNLTSTSWERGNARSNEIFVCLFIPKCKMLAVATNILQSNVALRLSTSSIKTIVRSDCRAGHRDRRRPGSVHQQVQHDKPDVPGQIRSGATVLGRLEPRSRSDYLQHAEGWHQPDHREGARDFQPFAHSESDRGRRWTVHLLAEQHTLQQRAHSHRQRASGSDASRQRRQSGCDLTHPRSTSFHDHLAGAWFSRMVLTAAQIACYQPTSRRSSLFSFERRT
ncbi:hypothetical protein K0M31_017130 [Melipona bicolor]|uniref:Uncharacterized protein n=1 Tax=Melipona bicolor TaxID=60889 RepID=A0AA40FDE8_9HYME|nr:hypothetical protein K0M31_017130 [Melipona bicolor]